MDIEAKIKEDMKSFGCKSDVKIALAYHLYVYLVDEKLMYDTEYCYNKDIDTLYIMGRPSKNEKMNIYVPIPTCDDLCLEFINKMQENLCTVETGPTINLAFVEGDSTTVIYSFTMGLAGKESSENVALHRKKQERKTFINNELKKCRNEILNNALDGGMVDDDDCQILE